MMINDLTIKDEKVRVLIVFGTRPEAIKMACLVRAFLKETEIFDTKVCVTAQHREMLNQVLEFFEITPDYNLDVMRPNQNLYGLTADIIRGMQPVFEEYNPHFVFVHGDTTTSMAAGLAAFYAGAKVCHVEAGLRTFDKESPFPEEVNRQITARLAEYHFAPTEMSKLNLMTENISEHCIHVTGNTVIDSLLEGTKRIETYSDNIIAELEKIVDTNKKIILVTGHRRENHGEGFVSICRALKKIADNNAGIQVIYPVHLNPSVQEPVYKFLSSTGNITLIDPVPYPAFIWLMSRSYMIMTDSGGIQEEAPSLGKPVLVMRDNSERPEAIAAGTIILVGTDEDRIVAEAQRLLDDPVHYQLMSGKNNPYGDGQACNRIVGFMKKLSKIAGNL